MYSRVLIAAPALINRGSSDWLLQWSSSRAGVWREVEGGEGPSVNRSSHSPDRAHADQYSIAETRSLFAMVARRALQNMNGSASLFLVRPFVVMAARVLGPGPTRLRLVRLAHNLTPGGAVAALPEAAQDENQRAAVQPTSRAA